jgi:hypothetical protein
LFAAFTIVGHMVYYSVTRDMMDIVS